MPKKYKITLRYVSIFRESVICLILFGLALVYSASSYRAARLFDDELYFVKRQIMFCMLGLVLMWIAKKAPMRLFRKIAFPLVIVSFSLVALTISAHNIYPIWDFIKNVKWWLGQFPIYQVVMFSIVLYWAYAMEKSDLIMESSSKGILLPLAFACLFTLYLLVLDNFIVAFMVTVLVVILLVVSRVKLFHLFSALLLYTGLIVITVIGFTPRYKYMRLFHCLNPWGDDLKSQYYGSIDIWSLLVPNSVYGVGLGHGTNKLIYGHELDSYNILMVISEELGWLGLLSISLRYALLVFGGILISVNSRDAYQRYLSFGMAAMIAVCLLEYLFAYMGFGGRIPLIGYGGSSLIIMLTCIGILLNVSSQNHVKNIHTRN